MLPDFRVSAYSPDEHKIPGRVIESYSPGGRFVRSTIQTGFIFPHQNPESFLQRFIPRIDEFPGSDKVVCIGSKVVSVMQGRFRRINEIHPGIVARFATQFGTRTIHGRGVAGYPEKLQAAIDEVGVSRIILASIVSAAEKLALKTRILRERRGLFFVIAGDQVKAIDGLFGGDGYDRHVLLAPRDPQQLCDRLSCSFGYPVAVVDINDLGGDVQGLSKNSSLTRSDVTMALSDNPAGQEYQRTPISIVGRV